MNEKIQKEIIPTVMPDSYDDFNEKIEKVFRFAKTIQIDVMDGMFVSSTSWPYNSRNDLNWEKLVMQEDGIPHWENCDFEIDLMVKNQYDEASKWIDAGVSRVIGHYEAFFMNGLDSENEIEKFINLKQERGVEVYLAISPDTDNSVLEKYLDRIDGVQFMGIKNVGYQGQPFEKKVLEKISELRKIKPEMPIAIDGGVNFETAKDLIDAGANKLSCGSIIFNASNPKDVFEQLKEIL